MSNIDADYDRLVAKYGHDVDTSEPVPLDFSKMDELVAKRDEEAKWEKHRQLVEKYGEDMEHIPWPVPLTLDSDPLKSEKAE